MKIELQHARWGEKYLTILWDAPYLPRIGEAIQVSAFLSAEDIALLEKTPATKYGYPKGYHSAFQAMDDSIASRVYSISWYKDRQGRTAIYMLPI